MARSYHISIMEPESTPSGSDSEGKSPIITTVQPGKPFSKEVAAVLEALYSRGMTARMG